ncbi:MAG: methyltransferase domain-containing protein [Pseudonocardiales bacterium]
MRQDRLKMAYALQLSEDERARYRFMAEGARTEEHRMWAAAGISSGARVADIGCGPGAVLRLLAEEVGQTGRADGVDADAATVAAAQETVADLPQATTRIGDADASGLTPGEYDVAMCRHVLAHNGGREATIVAHLRELVRPGGAVYLVDVDVTAMRIYPEIPDFADLHARYVEFHRAQGNDIIVGQALGSLLETAGLDVEIFRIGGPVLKVPAGMRGPAWAAREALVSTGFATTEDIARWDAMFERVDRLPTRPWITVAPFVAVGRAPR